MADLIEIKEGRKSKSKEKPAKEKVLKAKVMEDICFLLSGKNDCVPEGLGRWPYKLILVKQILSDDPLILKVDENNVAQVHSVEGLAGELFTHLRLMQPLFKGKFQWAFPIKECLEAVKTWRLSSETTRDMPKSFATREDPSICFFRSQYEPDLRVRDIGTLEWMAPTWHSIVKRLSNGEAFCKSIGRIYDLRADRKQAVWIVGESDTGKSQIMWFIGHLVGGGTAGNGAYHAVGASDIAKGWWTGNAIGKRIISTSEARYDFLSTELFKSLTGDDMMTVESKCVQPKLVKNELLFYFYSNKNPEIPGDADFKNRIIMCNLSPFEGPKMDEADFRELLMAEAEPFLGYCRNLWNDSRGRIDCDMTELNEIIEEREDVYHSVFNACFAADPNERVRSDIVHEKIRQVYTGKMHHRAFVNVWRREYGVKYVRVKESFGGAQGSYADKRKNVGYYVGLRCLSAMEAPGFQYAD